MIPLPMVAGRDTRRRNGLGIVGATDHVTAQVVTNAGRSGSSDCSSVVDD
jgi:hypothetical protein